MNNVFVKQSSYNIKIDDYSSNGKLLIYNSFSGALIEIEKQILDYFPILTDKIFDESTLLDNNKEIYKQLRGGNFLIDVRSNEVVSLKYLYNLTRFHSKATNLTILPTLACNFNCSYCYQEYRNGLFMNELVQNKIIEYIKNRIKQKTTAIHIEWYGGEPLLGMNIISNISEKVIELAQNAGISYSSGMITNGYLIDEVKIKQLQKYKIQSLQITIDGLPEFHNKKRKLLNGEETFWKVLENIKMVSKFIQVNLRINIDKENFNSIYKLIDILIDYGLNKENVNPYLGLILATTSACKNVASICLSEEKFATINSEFLEYTFQKGFKSFIYPRPGYAVCGAVTEGVFSIDPSGNLFKCWETVAVEEEAVGNILEDYPKVENQVNYFNWMNYDPFTRRKCIKCNIFPICFGNCPSSIVSHSSRKIYNKRKCNSFIYKDYLNSIINTAIKHFEENNNSQRKEVCDQCVDQKDVLETPV